MLNLPMVTLTTVETVEHELSRLSINDSVAQVSFGEVLILTDKPDLFKPLDCDARFITIPPNKTKLAWEIFRWNELPKHICTSHVLFSEWDSGVWDASKWKDKFLNYDLISAPWPFFDRWKVGNGGFRLTTTALIRYVAKHRDRFPCTDQLPGDNLLCRTYRPQLEAEGFVWAPEQLARDFALECETAQAAGHFGYHAMQNFPDVMSREKLYERLQIAQQSEWIVKNGHMVGGLRAKHPEIIDELKRSIADG